MRETGGDRIKKPSVSRFAQDLLYEPLISWKVLNVRYTGVAKNQATIYTDEDDRLVGGGIVDTVIMPIRDQTVAGLIITFGRRAVSMIVIVHQTSRI